MLGSAKGGYSKKESFNLSSIVSNTVRRMSDHTLDHEESEGEGDINKGAKIWRNSNIIVEEFQ